jgi:hypothetical protein
MVWLVLGVNLGLSIIELESGHISPLCVRISDVQLGVAMARGFWSGYLEGGDCQRTVTLAQIAGLWVNNDGGRVG